MLYFARHASVGLKGVGKLRFVAEPAVLRVRAETRKDGHVELHGFLEHEPSDRVFEIDQGRVIVGAPTWFLVPESAELFLVPDTPPWVLESIAKDPFGPDFGPMPIDALIGFMAAELAVHTWDLARTAKVDERLDPGLVKYTNSVWRALPDEVLRSQGMMGAKTKVERGADTQTRMLNYLGRAV